MNFERVGIDEASLIRKMSRIRFFDSLSGKFQLTNSHKICIFQSVNHGVGTKIFLQGIFFEPESARTRGDTGKTSGKFMTSEDVTLMPLPTCESYFLFANSPERWYFERYKRRTRCPHQVGSSSVGFYFRKHFSLLRLLL